MANVVLDFTFSGRQVANLDGTFATQLPDDARLMPVSWNLQGQNLSQAVIFGPSGPLVLDLNSYNITTTSQFHARVVFEYRGTNPPQGAPYPPKVLLQANFIPFSLNLVFRDGNIWLQSQVTVAGPDFLSHRCATQTYNIPPINPDTPYSAELVWDNDKHILVTFLNGITISCHGCGPSGHVQPPGAVPGEKTVVIGGPKGPATPSHFTGAIGAVQIEMSIPGNLKDQVALQKESPQWYITTKLETLRLQRDLGQPSGPITQQGSVYTQQYTAGAISYHPPIAIFFPAQVFELHGTFWYAYKNLPEGIRTLLGYQTSDETSWTEGGITGRRVLFSNGQLEAPEAGNPDDAAIYAVVGEIVKARSNDGGMARWGFALENQNNPLPNSVDFKYVIMQRFQHGTFYQKNLSTAAWGLFGPIDQKHRDAGGPRKIPLPIGPEEKIRGVKVRIGLFPNMTEIELDVRKSPLAHDWDIYWSPTTSANLINGSIRRYWLEFGGPTESAGLPISDPRLDVRTEIQDFQRGMVIVKHTLTGNELRYTPRSFRLWIDYISTGWPPDATEPGRANDVYIDVQIEKRTRGNALGTLLLDHRYPDGPARVWKDSQRFHVNPMILLPPVMQPAMDSVFVVKVRVYDEDKPPSGTESHDTLIGEGSFTLDYNNVFMMTEGDESHAYGPVEIRLSSNPSEMVTLIAREW